MSEFFIETVILEESGIDAALYGLGMSFGITSGLPYKQFVAGKFFNNKEEPSPYRKMLDRAAKLAPMDKGHNKVLESMTVHFMVRAPRYWWQEFDTYRVGMTKQSESTMHTLSKRVTTPEDYEPGTPHKLIAEVNGAIQGFGEDNGPDLVTLKKILPEGFLQRRVMCSNYKTLRHICLQRKNHRLPHWKKFLNDMTAQLSFGYMLME